MATDSNSVTASGAAGDASGSGAVGSAVGDLLPRSFFARDPDQVARDLIGRVIVVPVSDEASGSSEHGGPTEHNEPILLRLTETEAYHGGQDPASHAYRGPTPRTAVMFGPPGFLYVYFVYGMHWCANVVTGVDGEASAVLLRAAEVTGNVAAARSRRISPRGRVPRDVDLARGPARLASAIGLSGANSGADLCADAAEARGAADTVITAAVAETRDAAATAATVNNAANVGGPPFRIHSGAGRRPQVQAGPRVGVAAAAEIDWRFYEVGARSVSTYRAGARRKAAR